MSDFYGLEKVVAVQDVDAMSEMACDLVNIPSETGFEGPIGDYVAKRFSELGLDIDLQEVEEGRNNVIARLRGSGAGPSLMLLAHFDTSTNPAEDLPRGYQPVASVEDGWIVGLGISNMKCAFAGFWSALQMLRDAGVEFPGEIIVAGVVGEILKAPVDEWRGRRYRGGGLGASYMLSHGVTADFCINGEPTGLRLQPMNGGYTFLRIHIEGDPQETFSKKHAIDPLPKALRVYEALSSWEAAYQRAHSHPYIRPQILVGSIYGGYPYKPHITAPSCNLYLHVQTVPGQTTLEVRREVEAVLAEIGASDPDLRASVDAYLTEDGYELGFDHPGVQAVAAGHQSVFGVEASIPNPERNAISSDNNALALHGIPAVTYGAGGVGFDGDYRMYEPGLGEVVSIENLAAYARVCAVAGVKFLSGQSTDVVGETHTSWTPRVAG